MSADQPETDQPVTAQEPSAWARLGGARSSGALVPESEVPFSLTPADLDPDYLPPGVSVQPEKPRKVAIIGYTISNRQAPWDDPDWAIWGMNDMHQVIRDTRWDGWVDVHDRQVIDSNPEHEKWLRELHPFPIWMREPRPEYPSARPFPMAELVERFGSYITNTVSWQVAYAITQVEWAVGDGAEIGVWGVDMAQGTEYAAQRPSCEYFIGLARGMGITVTVAETSDLLKTANPYGSTEGTAMLTKLGERVFELEERLGGVRNQRAQAQAHDLAMRDAENQLLGALEQAKYLIGTWFPPAVGKDATRAPNDIRAIQQAKG